MTTSLPSPNTSIFMTSSELTAGMDAELRVHGIVTFFSFPFVLLYYFLPHKAWPNQDDDPWAVVASQNVTFSEGRCSVWRSIGVSPHICLTTNVPLSTFFGIPPALGTQGQFTHPLTSTQGLIWPGTRMLLLSLACHQQKIPSTMSPRLFGGVFQPFAFVYVVSSFLLRSSLSCLLMFGLSSGVELVVQFAVKATPR